MWSSLPCRDSAAAVAALEYAAASMHAVAVQPRRTPRPCGRQPCRGPCELAVKLTWTNPW